MFSGWTCPQCAEQNGEVINRCRRCTAPRPPDIEIKAARDVRRQQLEHETQDLFGDGEAVIVRSYPGRNQSDAARFLAYEAPLAAAYGYTIQAQSWADGRAGIGRVLLAGEFADVLRPKGFLTVTYQRTGLTEADTKVCPECAETVKAAARICRFCRYEFETPLPD